MRARVRRMGPPWDGVGRSGTDTVEGFAGSHLLLRAPGRRSGAGRRSRSAWGRRCSRRRRRAAREPRHGGGAELAGALPHGGEARPAGGGTSSKPTSETSSGTSSPRSRSASQAPSAMRSLPAIRTVAAAAPEAAAERQRARRAAAVLEAVVRPRRRRPRDGDAVPRWQPPPAIRAFCGVAQARRPGQQRRPPVPEGAQSRDGRGDAGILVGRDVGDRARRPPAGEPGRARGPRGGARRGRRPRAGRRPWPERDDAVDPRRRAARRRGRAPTSVHTTSGQPSGSATLATPSSSSWKYGLPKTKREVRGSMKPIASARRRVSVRAASVGPVADLVRQLPAPARVVGAAICRSSRSARETVERATPSRSARSCSVTCGTRLPSGGGLPSQSVAQV
jgi:hypothetical protein